MAEIPPKDPESEAASVFSPVRSLVMPALELPDHFEFNTRLQMDGLEFLAHLPEGKFPVAFLDPQYRGLLDKMSYGNEGRSRNRGRSSMQQMDEEKITAFVRGIDRALMPSGHLFLWMDKFHLCTGFSHWLTETKLAVVDLVTWDKGRIGMGYRTRRKSEHLVVLQKTPRRAKGVWKKHDIPDVWAETVPRGAVTHRKPVELQGALIAAVTNPGDVVIDPAAGSFSVLEACRERNRVFLGCDVEG